MKRLHISHSEYFQPIQYPVQDTATRTYSLDDIDEELHAILLEQTDIDEEFRAILLEHLSPLEVIDSLPPKSVIQHLVN